jgi:hypothetical protein
VDKVEKYIKSLCKDLYLEPAEISQFKEEIRNHLLDTIEDLRIQGMSEDEAVEAALKRFGEEKQINLELRKVHHFQKKFKNTILIAAIVFLILALIIFISSGLIGQQNSSDWDGLLHDYYSQNNKFRAGEGITNEDIQALFQKHEHVLRFIHITKSESDSLQAEYLYPPNISSEEFDVQPYLSPYPVLTENSNTKWEMKFGLKRSFFTPVPEVLFNISLVCFAIYWILFGLWNVMYAYHMNRLNMLWIILFFTLNIFAYFLFEIERKIKLRKLKAA